MFGSPYRKIRWTSRWRKLRFSVDERGTAKGTASLYQCQDEAVLIRDLLVQS